MSSDYYHGMVQLLNGLLTAGVMGLYVASMEGAGFQSLDMITGGGAGSSS